MIVKIDLLDNDLNATLHVTKLPVCNPTDPDEYAVNFQDRLALIQLNGTVATLERFARHILKRIGRDDSGKGSASPDPASG